MQYLVTDHEETRRQVLAAMAEAEGWTVLRIWEHVPPEEAVRLIVRALDEGEEPNGRL